MRVHVKIFDDDNNVVTSIEQNVNNMPLANVHMLASAFSTHLVDQDQKPEAEPEQPMIFMFGKDLAEILRCLRPAA